MPGLVWPPREAKAAIVPDPAFLGGAKRTYHVGLFSTTQKMRLTNLVAFLFLQIKHSFASDRPGL